MGGPFSRRKKTTTPGGGGGKGGSRERLDKDLTILCLEERRGSERAENLRGKRRKEGQKRVAKKSLTLLGLKVSRSGLQPTKHTHKKKKKKKKKKNTQSAKKQQKTPKNQKKKKKKKKNKKREQKKPKSDNAYGWGGRKVSSRGGKPMNYSHTLWWDSHFRRLTRWLKSGTASFFF